MAVIAEALAQSSADHPVFYEDEVDIHLNPKIGADWQLSGTGKASYVGDCSKKSGLFISLLKHLKGTYRRALHGTITRNHSYFLKKVCHFMKTVSPFPGRKHDQAKV